MLLSGVPVLTYSEFVFISLPVAGFHEKFVFPEVNALLSHRKNVFFYTK